MLDWLYTAISWVMAQWHSLWDLVFGDPPPESGLAGLAWVLAIVYLVVTIRLILFPLFVKQVKSQRAMQELQPEIQKLRTQYGSDRQGMSQAMMALQKERGVNPLAGCLPILPQIPIFFALFFVLRDFEDEIFRPYQAAGETVADLEWLSLVTITEATKAGWGPLLIVAYGVSQFTSTWLMSQTMQPMQRALMLILPVAFIPFVLNFPAGLMLYWLTTNLWTTGQGLITRRLMPKREPPPP